MSHTSLVGYNSYVARVNLLKRGMTVAISLVIVALLTVSSVWAPLIKLLHISDQAVIVNDKLTASIALSRAAQYSLREFELLEQAGTLAYEAGDQKAAQSYLEQVKDSGELSPTGVTILGDIAQKNGDTQNAIGYWESALRSGADEELYTKLVQAYRHIGDWDLAIRAQKDLVTLIPNNPEYSFQTGLMLAASNPGTAIGYLTLAGDLDSSLKTKSDSLLRNLRSALNRDEQSYPLVIAGQELAAIDEWELALLAFSNATLTNPNNADAWAYLGEAHQHSNQDGFNELKRALILDPESLSANTLMALYWQRQERYDLALVYLYAAAQLDDNNPALQAEIGNTLGLLGNIPAAETHYQLAVSMDQKDPTYWRSLANYYIRYEIDIKTRGAAAARQAVILSPEDPESLDILAQVYLLQENQILAARFLNRALAADEEYAPAQINSGLVSLLEGDQLGAYQHFTAAKTFATPGSPTADRAERLLEIYFP